MKRIIYSLLIAFAASLTFTACTEEEVAPSEVRLSSGGSGGSGYTDSLK